MANQVNFTSAAEENDTVELQEIATRSDTPLVMTTATELDSSNEPQEEQMVMTQWTRGTSTHSSCNVPLNHAQPVLSSAHKPSLWESSTILA